MYWRGLQSGLIVHQSVSIAQKLAVRLLDKFGTIIPVLILTNTILNEQYMFKG